MENKNVLLEMYRLRRRINDLQQLLAEKTFHIELLQLNRHTCIHLDGEHVEYGKQIG